MEGDNYALMAKVFPGVAYRKMESIPILQQDCNGMWRA